MLQQKPIDGNKVAIYVRWSTDEQQLEWDGGGLPGVCVSRRPFPIVAASPTVIPWRRGCDGSKLSWYSKPSVVASFILAPEALSPATTGCRWAAGSQSAGRCP